MSTTSTARPRARARRLLAAGGLALAVLVLSACLTTDQQTVVDQVNADRRANGKSALNVDYQAAQKAQAWAEHMARTGVLEHTGGGSKVDPSGISNWCYYAENVGMGPNLPGINTAFLNSPPHKANILSATDRVGTGVAKSGGYYWVTQVFVRSC